MIESAPGVDRAEAPLSAVVEPVLTPPLERVTPLAEPVVPALLAVEPATSERQSVASEPPPVGAVSASPTEVLAVEHVATDATDAAGDGIARINALPQPRNTTVEGTEPTVEPAAEATRRSSLGAPSSPPSSAASRFAVPVDRAALPGRGTRIP